MLILKRRSGQSLLIGDDVWVKVLESKDGETSLGITAPDDVNIKRSEVVARERDKERIARED